MKTKAGEISLGQTIKYQNKILRIIDKQEITPGRRAAILHLNTIDIVKANKIDLRMSPSDFLEVYGVYNVTHIYSYYNNKAFIFVNKKTFEEVIVSESIIDANKVKFLQEEQELDLALDEEGNFITIIWPVKVISKVKYAPVSQKHSAVDDKKRVELENGVFVTTPGYVKDGDKLLINLETMEVLGRV